ncbi:unnamed protein product [Urochloa decumbens]|uniref:C2H2-type domain-containing protein n=1 Tax=Urochloa decumbens TaxID=240449 RepID=A0ABC9FTJ9_9POAL
MEFARRGRSDGDVDDDHRFLHFNPSPPHVDPMLVIREALLSQLQKDRLRQEIILAELAKIEHAMVLRNNARHGIATDDVEWAEPIPFTFREESAAHCQWSVGQECYVNVDEIHDPKKKDGRNGSVELKSGNAAMEYHVCECLRPCCNGKVGQENAKLEEEKLQESTETKRTSPSVKWELTEITIPIKKPVAHWELTCGICQVQVTSEHSLQEHCAGRKHRSKVATMEMINKAISQKAQLTEESSSYTEQKTSSIRWSCSTCQVNGTSQSDLKDHLNGGTHQQNIEGKHVESKGVAENIELHEPKRHKSNTPQHGEKPVPVWSCSICQANCVHESESRGQLLAKIQALLDEINSMPWKSKSQEAMAPPTVVPQHAKQASGWNCSILKAGSEFQPQLENQIGGMIHQLNAQALHGEAKKTGNFLPQTTKNQQPPSGWDCSICQAKCHSESQFIHHCSGRKHQKKIEALQGQGESAKSSDMMVDDKVPSNGSDSNSSTLEKVEERTTLYSCEVNNLLCNSNGVLADHCNVEHMEEQNVTNFCEVCNLQCNSEKMIADHHSGSKHQKSSMLNCS